MKIIKAILVEGQGWVYAQNGRFEWKTYNGQMAEVPWIMQHTNEGISEYNLAYVVQIIYFNE